MSIVWTLIFRFVVSVIDVTLFNNVKFPTEKYGIRSSLILSEITMSSF